MNYIIVVLIGYLLGSSSMSYYLGKLNQVDIRNQGSKNLGASNAMILMGWKAGVLVGVHDIGKSILAVLIARYLFPDLAYAGEIAGVASVLGHIYPFYLKFKGGKGLASFIGMSLALNWKIGLAVILLLIVMTLVTDYIVVGTVSVIVSVPALTAFLQSSMIAAGIILVASVVIAWKHRVNYVRIANGTEIRFRKANQGEYRVK